MTESHRSTRSDDDRIVPFEQLRSLGSDGTLFGHVALLLLVDVAVADVGADENRTAVRTIELLLRFEVGEVLADGHLRNLEHLGQLRDRNRPVLLQQRQNTAVPFGQAQQGLFTDLIIHSKAFFVDYLR